MPSSSSGTTTTELSLHAFYTATQAYLAYRAIHHDPIVPTTDSSCLSAFSSSIPRLLHRFFATALELDTLHFHHNTPHHHDGLRGQHDAEDSSTFRTVMADLVTAQPNAVTLLDGLSSIMDRTAGTLRRCGRESEALEAQALAGHVALWVDEVDATYAKAEAETRVLNKSMAGVTLRAGH